MHCNVFRGMVFLWIDVGVVGEGSLYPDVSLTSASVIKDRVQENGTKRERQHKTPGMTLWW